MSSDNQIKDRMERSCHLTLKQYNIILSYLNTGIKPPIRTLADADLLGNLNGGVNKSGKYHRLKSIASRLMLRPTDGALLFASNGKVVIPSSRFVQTIRQAHRGTGDKHLNCSQTLAKLQETYTIGRRQFGICEDQIRDVVKSCNQGSCRRSSKRNRNYGTPAKKARLDDEGKSHEQPKEMGSELLKSLLAINMYQSPAKPNQTMYIPNIVPNTSQALNNSTTTLGNIQPSLNVQNCVLVINPTLTVPPSSSLTDLRSFSNPTKLSSNHTTLTNLLSSNQSSYVYILPTTTQAGINALPGQLSTSINQTNSATNLFSVQNTVSVLNKPQSCVRFIGNQAFSNPIATSSPESSISTLSDVSSIINSFSSFVESEDSVSMKSLDCSGPSLLEPDDSLAFIRYDDTDHASHPEPNKIDEEEEPSHLEGTEIQIERKNDIVPFPHIWHYYKDFNAEKNPFQKIYIGIQDMKLDLMRSLIGDMISAERLKKKINYLDQLVKTQKTITEPYKMDLLQDSLACP